jgi:hypothetical protein
MFFQPKPDARHKKLISWAKSYKIDLPQHPEELALVQKLDLKGKKFEVFPKEIDCLPNLLEFDASCTGITSLPWEFSSLKKLKVINLDHNKFQDVPGVICQMSQLEKLSMEANQIKKVSHVIANMVSLNELNLSFNSIFELPNEFCSLKHLVKLNLAANSLSELPKAFSKLYNLAELDLSMNKFDIDPEILKELPNLKVINFNQDLNKINEQLVVASSVDNLSLALRLISLGADVNYKYLGFGIHSLTTPLFEAQSIEMVKLLLNNNADPNISREIIKTSSIKVWESDKAEQETFLTKKHTPEVTKYLKSIALIS